MTTLPIRGLYLDTCIHLSVIPWHIFTLQFECANIRRALRLRQIRMHSQSEVSMGVLGRRDVFYNTEGTSVCRLQELIEFHL